MEFASETDPDPGRYTERFRRALLEFGSDTDDNRAAVHRVDVGDLQDCRPAFLRGLRIVGSGHSISGILNSLEGEDIPDATRKACPDLAQDDFDAALRIAVLCLSAFDNPKPR